MARIVSFVALVVILLLIGGLFIQVMAGFLLPLFLSLLLVIMFGPVHRWFVGKCGRHDRVAALLTTGTIALLVLVPLSLLLFRAGCEAHGIYSKAVKSAAMAEAKKSGDGDTSPAPPEKTAGQDNSGTKADEKLASPDLAAFIDRATRELELLGKRVGVTIDRDDLAVNLEKAAKQFLAPLALRTTQFLWQMLVGAAIMLLGTYYFFADGTAMLQSLLRLSPVENSRTRELIDQFDSVTRAVVVATLLSAFVQGLLAGVGFYVAGVSSVFLLTALAILFALVPFVGTAIIWAPVCLWLFGVDGHTTAAIVLAVYCMVVVSTVDNVVKPMVLQGRSNLHPLLALLSVLGGVDALGPIGIFVGPMIVAFLQTLINMVSSELKSMT